MKKTPSILTSGLALAALLCASGNQALAQVPDLTISEFGTGTPGVQPNGAGTWYGAGQGAWDSSFDNTSGGGGGALYMSCPFSSSSDTPTTEYVCLPGENPWWHQPTAIAMSQYKSIQFDIMWDNAFSDLTIPQFNDLSTFPAEYLQSWAPTQYLAGSIRGLDILCAYGDGSVQFAWLTNFSIPTEASNGWVHIKLAIDPSASGIDGGSGILFKKWINQQWGISGTHTANFWVDNVMLEGTAAPPPPPTIQPLTKTVSGLNVFANSPGIYDRQSAELMLTNGLSWVGHATEANPVTYSFTIKDAPVDSATAYGVEAYLFMIPNLIANDGAPDWNETNCIIASVQHTSNGSAFMNFQYKVDEDHNNMMYATNNNAGSNPYTNAAGSWDGIAANYLETGNLGSVTNPTPNGTWSIRFTSNTNVTLIAPNGNSTNLVFPSYNASKFASDTNFVVYLGQQANNSASLNKAVVYSNFGITGTPSPFSENFLAESSLDTTNTWRTSVAASPKGLQVLTSASTYLATWTLPDAGFALQTAGSITGPWTTLTNGPVIPMAGLRGQVISSGELPGADAAFFRLIK